jgi:glycosyltransferase involved in cell wall biosynthesis
VDRLKVLALVTRLPVPPWRGDQVRAYHHLRVLAARHDVTLCVLPLTAPRAADVAAVEGLGVRVHVTPLGLTGAPVALLRAAIDGAPLQTLLFRRRRARTAVHSLLASERFDVVHAQLVRTAAYWPGADGPPVVLDLVDALSANFERRAERDRGPLAWVSALERGRLVRAERDLVRRAAVTLVVAEPDRRAIGDGSVRVVPNGVDPAQFPRATGPRVAGRIVFGGNLGYFPNVDAARWLVEEILPAVRARLPEATVHLVGARPTAAVRALATRPGVSLAANVPSMAAEIGRATVAVIPMRSGSGLQNKVLEAMAVGTPVVTTPQVASGLVPEATGALALGTTTEELAEHAAALLADAGRAAALAGAGDAVVAAHYRWETSAAAVEQAWLDAHRPA